MKTTPVPEAKEAVGNYWQAAPCRSSLRDAEPGSKAFLDEIEAAGYAREPFVLQLAELKLARRASPRNRGWRQGQTLSCCVRAVAILSGIALTLAPR
jgi:hypothetical protein